ncbi:MAG TPA: TlpA disulfide reductase family protein [Bacteroidota bacterium]|nr:TlpA disulfide reductase family protein [Bacteroidota bacterium]
MHRTRWWGVAIAVAAFAAASWTQDKGPAPNFTLPTATGGTIELAKLHGKVVVVNFWATWCGPCRSEIPGMQEVYEKYKSKGLEIIGVSLDQKGWDVINPFVKRMNISYPVVLGNNQVAESYGHIDAIPATFIVGKKGEVLQHHVGYMSKEEFEQAVKAAL